MRAVTVKGSILLTPIRPPTESEYREILKKAGRPLPKEPPDIEEKIQSILRKVRTHGRRD